MEPHVCQINQLGVGAYGEWVSVANGGTSAVALTGLELTDFTATQRHVHVIRFPSNANGTDIMLGPGEVAFVFTHEGENRWVQQEDGTRQLWLFAGRKVPIWNNAGDVAYLRRLDGTFVDSLTVGQPTRHPAGH